MQRLISFGRLKGLKIPPVKSGTRPTSAMMTQALFDILRPHIEPGQRFLDLFSGSGNIGLHAISAGFDIVHCVEMNRSALLSIKQALSYAQGMNVNEDFAYKTYHMDAKAFIRQVKTTMPQYDVIYFDPPYAECLTFFKEMAEKIVPLLNDQGLVVIEHAQQDAMEMDEVIAGSPFSLVQRKKYGNKALAFAKAN